MLNIYNPGKCQPVFGPVFLHLCFKSQNSPPFHLAAVTQEITSSFNRPAPFFKCLKLVFLLFTLIFGRPLSSQTLPSGFTSTVVSSAWNEAVGLTFNKTGNQMFVWERPGRVWVVENGQKQLLIDIREEVAGYRDFGLLGFALHPQFETNGYFYLLYNVDRHYLMKYGTSSYSATTNEYYQASIGRLTRYTATKTTTGYTVNITSRKILIGATKSTGIPYLHESHGVGSLLFGTDGTLIISAGDGASYLSDDAGSASETYYAQGLADGIITNTDNIGSFRSQLLESYNGKILRIDPETGNGIPSNPFYETTSPGSVRSKVWALGLRNPFRMSLKPNTGSINPADGNPGVLYAGDVGYTMWEELNVVTKPGMNFGWPLFEGLTVHSGYWNKKTYNLNAPNSLYNTNGCTQQYFYFQDLIKQATHSGTASFVNPCNTTQPYPSTVKTFLHSRPVIDWKHYEAIARTGTFNGETATVTNIGASGSPVTGSMFSGSAAIAGVVYPHSDFPIKYRNTFFFGDYGSGMIRNLTFDVDNNPTSVNAFIPNNAIVVAMATHPTETGLYYVNFPSEIKKVTYYKTNQPPVAVASADKTYGPSPLNVQFTGSSSHDPDGQQLSYMWNFGDGATSTLINPAHSFTGAANTPTQYSVTLTVTDNQGGSNQTALVISVNNTPPQVTITSPDNNSLYPITGQTTYNLRATVSDLEHSSSQLAYRWQTTLHHENHEHPEPVNTSPETTAVIDPLGCGAESYYYSITLTVTDAAGLATTKVVKLYPDCNKTPTVSFTSPANNASFTAPATINLAVNAADADGTVSKIEYFSGATKIGESTTAPYTYSWMGVAAGTYSLTAKATDNTGATTTSAAVSVNVNATQPASGFPVVKNSVWKYHDKGIDLGTAWTAPGYDDAAWSAGAAVLGYGDPVTTTLSYGASSTSKHPSYYFRHSFDVADASRYSTLIFNLRQDDGAVVYLNGVEQFRTNMPTGGIFYNTYAASALGGADETTYYSFRVPASQLRTGRNVLAVSVHQENGGSSDMTFDMELQGEASTNQLPAVSITSPANNAGFTAPATINLAANAADADGTVNKVAFFNGATWLGEDLTAPYTYSWTGVAAGTYSLTAKATDNTGAVTTSAAVSVNVNASSGSGQSVVSFALINAENDQQIQILNEGSIIILDNMPTKKLNIRATTNPSAVGSVVFVLTGAATKNNTDDTAPYTLYSTKNGSWIPTVGNYTLKATPYGATGGNGTAGTSLTINFKLVKSQSGTSAMQTVKIVSETADEFQDFSVNYFPNPFKDQFTMVIQGEKKEKLPVRIYDASGKLMRILADVPTRKYITLGKEFSSGIYVLIVGEGKKTRQYKLVKIP